MDPFSPVHQPDEGYSEEPLNPEENTALVTSLATLHSPAELPAWLASNASLLPLSVKTGMLDATRDSCAVLKLI